MDINYEASEVRRQLLANADVAGYIDSQRDWIPKPFGNCTNPKLIILGQDPTVKIPKSRDKIKVVLNLDKEHGSLFRYLDEICRGLNLMIREDIYATNLAKCFFIAPPTQIKEVNVLSATKKQWTKLLLKEIEPFAGVPIIALGEPLLRVLLDGSDHPAKVRHYWDYENQAGKLSCLGPDATPMGCYVFPFPHQPSASRPFYAHRLHEYVEFVSQRV